MVICIVLRYSEIEGSRSLKVTNVVLVIELKNKNGHSVIKILFFIKINFRTQKQN